MSICFGHTSVDCQSGVATAPGEIELTRMLWGSTGGLDATLRTLVKDQGFVEPEEIAAAVLFLASDDARHVTGVDLPVDDGFAIT
jgi:NAD(P)-dependent dehydrogenase (short-subunit alcohol dehydrogenase family)